jgi:hypothetical protein
LIINWLRLFLFFKPFKPLLASSPTTKPTAKKPIISSHSSLCWRPRQQQNLLQKSQLFQAIAGVLANDNILCKKANQQAVQAVVGVLANDKT